VSLVDQFRLDDNLDWTLRAACAGADNPDLWFPNQGTSNQPAKNVCARCPVRTDCLDYALDHQIRFGVWGGRSEKERKTMRGRTQRGEEAAA
jgi:WhiB family redox-sensing transcriptional regulator